MINNLEKLQSILATPQRIVITTHTKPDGDAIGSCLALYHFLIQQGHKVLVITPTPYAAYLHYLPGNEQVITYEGNEAKTLAILANTDMAFMLDFNEWQRCKGLGEILANHPNPMITVLIDHHLAPHLVADYALLDANVSSTAELIYQLIHDLKKTDLINRNVAECIYWGICSDTFCFRYNSTASTHKIASSLMETGINIGRLHRKLFENYSISRLNFVGFCLTKRLELYPEYHTAIMHLSLEDFQHLSYQPGDTEGLVNYPLNVGEIFFVILVKEASSMVKLSFRSKGKFSVKDFASKHFNGGGHKNASGAVTTLPLTKVLEKLRNLLPQYKQEIAAADDR